MKLDPKLLLILVTIEGLRAMNNRFSIRVLALSEAPMAGWMSVSRPNNLYQFSNITMRPRMLRFRAAVK